jgi:xylulose-5-phosphate/fructose-6-phosphate phosphoketolase
VSAVRENPEHLRILEAWMRRYRPEAHFEESGALAGALRELAPEGEKRLGATPHANGGRLRRPLEVPALGSYEVAVERRGATRAETTRPLGALLRDVIAGNRDRFRLFCPDETNSNRLGAVFEVDDRCLMDARPEDEDFSPDGRVMEVLSEHLCQGWLEGFGLSGRHGLFATYEAFAMVSASMLIQHAKWLEAAGSLEWRAPVSSLNVLLTSTCWRNDHNGFSHQGPGLIDTMISLRGSVTRIYFPPDANTLLPVAEHCLESTDYVNLIVVDKQDHLQYLSLDEGREHAAAGASRWEWAGSEDGGDPDLVLASIGDVPTMESLAAAALLREHTPDLRFRFVNVADLMTLPPPDVHPHGMEEDRFRSLFGDEVDVVTAFHGYARALHQILHGRPRPSRFHVRGYTEVGTTTTPFDMVVLNRMSRYHLAQEALRRVPRRPAGADGLERHCEQMLARHERYIREHLTDMPEVADWAWPG